MRRPGFLFCLFLLLLGPARWAGAQALIPPDTWETPEHLVVQGETLESIARRYGADVQTLMRINDLSDPRQIYAGQHLRISLAPAALDTHLWEEHSLGLGEDVALLSARNGLAWEDVAQANGLLNPGSLLVGQTLRLPPRTQSLGLLLAQPGETWTTLALRRHLPFWSVVRLNPAPLYTGAPVRLTDPSLQDNFVPYPLVALDLTPQPIRRGQTAILTIETAAPASCEITYIDHKEPCYTQDPTHLYAFVGLSPMLEPGSYDLGVRVWTHDAEASVTLPLVVAAGRFNFERIDLPADRQDLLDPGLIQLEADKLQVLQTVRTPQRYWQLPFPEPVQAAVSSYFGSRRSYGGGFNTYHAGVDFRAGGGVPVHAPAPGIVVLAEPLAVRGNAVIVDHGWGVLTGYWHLSRIKVEVGQRLAKGDVLGLVGNTGRSTGAHLHWEMWVNGAAVDPLQWTDAFCEVPEPVLPQVEGAQ